MPSTLLDHLWWADEGNDERKPRCTGVSTQQGLESGKELIHHIVFCIAIVSRELCTHPPRYSTVCSLCQNSTWWESWFLLEIPRVFGFDQSKPMTLLFCTPIWFGASTYSLIHTSALAPGGGKGHDLVSCWTHTFKTNSVQVFDSHTDSKMQPNEPPTFRRVVLPDDAGIGATNRLAHEIDVAALVDRDILGHVGDPGGY